MKKAYLIAFFLLLVPAVSFAQPEISFESVTHDFGELSQNDKPQHVFEFTNSGDKELMIQNITGS